MSLLTDIKSVLEYHSASFRVLPDPARKDLERILGELRSITEQKPVSVDKVVVPTKKKKTKKKTNKK